MTTATTLSFANLVKSYFSKANTRVAITNLIVKDLALSIDFYQKLFSLNCDIITPDYALFNYNDSRFCLIKESAANDLLNYNIVAPTSNTSTLTNSVTIFCDNCYELWSHAISCGATTMRKPFKTKDGNVIAIFSSPDNYIFIIKGTI